MKQKKPTKAFTIKEVMEAKAQTEQEEIHFYRSNEKPYGPLSNLYKCSVEFEERIFPTSEHAYQAGKARKRLYANGF